MENEEKIFKIFKISFLCFLWFFIALLLTFIFAVVNVKAESSITSSYDVNYDQFITSLDRIIWNDPNHNTKLFANDGRGYLNTLVFVYAGSSSQHLPTIRSVNARTDSGYSTCHVESFAENITSVSTQLYSINCDLNMSTNGLYSLSINFNNNSTSVSAFGVSVYRLTFSNNMAYQNSVYSSYIYDYLQNWVYPRLNGIETNTGATSQQLQWIYSYLQNYIYNELQSQNNAIEETKESVDNINNNITNDNVDDQGDFFTNFDSGDEGSLTDLIALPLDFISSLNNACTPISFPTINFHNFTFTLTIPCMSTLVYSHFNSNLINLLRLLINGIILYRMLVWFIDFIRGLKDPQNDDLEVMEL